MVRRPLALRPSLVFLEPPPFPTRTFFSLASPWRRGPGKRQLPLSDSLCSVFSRFSWCDVLFFKDVRRSIPHFVEIWAFSDSPWESLTFSSLPLGGPPPGQDSGSFFSPAFPVLFFPRPPPSLGRFPPEEPFRRISSFERPLRPPFPHPPSLSFLPP